MKLINRLFVGIFLLSSSFVTGQEALNPIDSLYLASVDHFYKNAEVAVSEIWEGMELAPFCLFRINGPALLYNHPNPPENFIRLNDKLYLGVQKDWQLFGATQREINGTLTAIIDYGDPRYSSIEEMYAVLFHELHHAYQRNFIKQITYDNPAILLTYPENYRNDGIKLYEQKVLYKMCFAQDSADFQKLLNQFYSSRLEREEVIGDYLRYEETVENMEGPAFYCEYRFYNQFASIDEVLKDNYNQTHFFGLLTTPFYGRQSLRQRHLASGMAMCYILDNHFDSWQSEYYSGSVSLYDFFISKFKPQKEVIENDSFHFDLSKFHSQNEVLGHQLAFNEFNTQQGTKITLKFTKNPQFNGFDPMSAESINDSTVLHTTFLMLSGGEQNKLYLADKPTVTINGEEIWFVKKVIFFVPEKSMVLTDNKIVIDNSGQNISWSGKLKTNTGNEVVFVCD